ncbi:MAG: alpha/beta hydrolase [Bacteroidota bacterium]
MGQSVREYKFDLLPEELKPTVKKTPPVKFENVFRARMGIGIMHLFMPKVATDGVMFRDLKLPRTQKGKGHLKIRVYTPQNNTEKERLGMVFMHWGGFVVGNLKTEHHRCVRLCRSEQMVIVSVKYRLAPENPFPCGLDDCEMALRWFHQNASDFGVNPEKIGVGGTSAGGGLAASLAIRCLRQAEQLINFQYLGFPVLDASCTTRSSQLHTQTPNWTSAANSLMWQYYLQAQPPSEISSPALADDLQGLPETYLWTAEFDPLHDEAVNYANKLSKNQVTVIFHDYSSCIHGFDSIPNSEGIIKQAHIDQSIFFEKIRESH